MLLLVSLPPEIILHILRYLPLHSLLSFGRTSKGFHTLSNSSVTALSIGIFPTRISSLVSSIHASSSSLPSIPLDHTVLVIMDRQSTRTKHQVLTFQNKLASEVTERYASSLHSLDLRLWEMQIAEALTHTKNLKHLALRMDHPFLRHRDIDKSYWNQAEGSTVWNELEGVWDRLEYLTLERAGITEWQLAQIMRTNPHLKGLRLKKCYGLGLGFWRDLVRSPGKDSLQRLEFTWTTNEEIDQRIIPYITQLKNLQVRQFCSILSGPRITAYAT